MFAGCSGKKLASPDDLKNELTNCIYLEDSFVILHGLKIYGTPWQPGLYYFINLQGRP